MTAVQSNASAPPLRDATKPGDQAPPGTPGTGENVCPRCGGSGRLRADGERCPECAGTGHVNTGIGGG